MCHYFKYDSIPRAESSVCSIILYPQSKFNVDNVISVLTFARTVKGKNRIGEKKFHSIYTNMCS